MADNTTLNTGTGGDVIATDDIAGVKHQRVKIEHGADGSATDVSTASPLPAVLQTAQAADGAASQPASAVQVGGWDGTNFQALATDSAGRPNVNVNGTVPVSDGGGSLTVDGSVTADTELTTADLDSGAGTDTRAVVGLVIAKSGGAANISNTDPLPISDAGGNISIDDGGNSITVDASAGTFGVNQAQVSGTAISVNSGVKDAGTQRVILASDQTVVPVSDNGGSLTVDNAGTFAVQIAANSSVNVAQVAGTATDVNSGTKSAGTQRVVLATDQPQLTNALKVDGSAVTQPVSGTVGLAPATSGGLSISHIVSAASTNATNVKASAGQLFGWMIYNSNAAARKVAFHNTAGTPTAGASVLFSIVIPPTSAANVEFTNGIAFSTGIGITMVTGLADSDSTGVAANDLVCNLFYK